MKRINVWSSPRNISTAFMYSFAQRPDTTVVDEPLYAHYLSKSDAELGHPGAGEVLASQENDGRKVVESVIFGSYDTPVALFKQMTHHLVHLDWSFMLWTKNILLIRDPKAIISSYSKVIPNPGMKDIGVEKQLELFEFLSKNGCLNAIVDTNELLKNPSGVLSRLCAALDLEFEERMLHWSAGARPEDGVWAKYWYSKVHSSTGFEAPTQKVIHLEGALAELAEKCQPFYEQLFEHAIKA